MLGRENAKRRSTTIIGSHSTTVWIQQERNVRKRGKMELDASFQVVRNAVHTDEKR